MARLFRQHQANFAQHQANFANFYAIFMFFCLRTPPRKDFGRSWSDFLLFEVEISCFFAVFPTCIPTRAKTMRFLKNLKKRCKVIKNQGFAFARMPRKSIENPSERASRPSRATDRLRNAFFSTSEPQNGAPRALRDVSGRSWVPLGALLGGLGPLLGRSWCALGRSWHALGRSWHALGRY